MKSVINTDGSSAIFFSKEEIKLHQTMLGALRFTNPKTIMLQVQWIVELEMAKYSNFASPTIQ